MCFGLACDCNGIQVGSLKWLAKRIKRDAASLVRNWEETERNREESGASLNADWLKMSSHSAQIGFSNLPFCEAHSNRINSLICVWRALEKFPTDLIEGFVQTASVAALAAVCDVHVILKLLRNHQRSDKSREKYLSAYNNKLNEFFFWYLYFSVMFGLTMPSTNNAN